MSGWRTTKSGTHFRTKGDPGLRSVIASYSDHSNHHTGTQHSPIATQTHTIPTRTQAKKYVQRYIAAEVNVLKVLARLD